MSDSAHETDAPKAVKHTYVSVGYPTAFFEHHVDGVDVLSETPIQVPAASLPALRDAALASGVDLIEEKS